MDSGPTLSPKDTREEEAGAPSSPSQKRRRRTTRHLSHSRCPRCRPPHSLLCTPPSPSFPPSGSRFILPSPLEERKRPGLLHLLLRGKGGGGSRGIPLLRVVVVAVPLVSLVSLLLSPLLPLLLLPPPQPPAAAAVAAAGAATAAATSPGLEHATPLRPPAATVAALTASQNVYAAKETGSSSR